MALNLEHKHQLFPGATYTKVASITYPDLGDAEVAWVRCEIEGRVSHVLMSDGDVLPEETDGGNRSDKGENELSGAERLGLQNALVAYSAEAVRRAQDTWMREARERNAVTWGSMAPVERVLDVATRAWGGEWFGQHYEGIVYAQEVARLLEMPNPDSFGADNPVWALIEELQDKELLELSGATLQRYAKRFRFPEEVHHMLAYIIEEPLGWPNGDAGDMALSTIENAIGKHTRFHHGQDLMWDDNFPHIAPRHLLQFGFSWLDSGIGAAERDGLQILGGYDVQVVAERLEGLAKRIRLIGSSDDAGLVQMGEMHSEAPPDDPLET